MQDIDEVIRYFPNQLYQLLKNVSLQNQAIQPQLQEIRIRVNRPIILKLRQADILIDYKISQTEIMQTLEKLCENSIYAYKNQICNGYLTIKGGHRIGLTGTTVVEDGKIINLKYITSFNFRIARQILGCGNKFLEEIINKEENTIYNTSAGGFRGIDIDIRILFPKRFFVIRRKISKHFPGFHIMAIEKHVGIAQLFIRCGRYKDSAQRILPVFCSMRQVIAVIRSPADRIIDLRAGYIDPPDDLRIHFLQPFKIELAQQRIRTPALFRIHFRISTLISFCPVGFSGLFRIFLLQIIIE